MHPYVIDRMVHERQDALSRMAQAEHRARAARWASAGQRRQGDERRVAAFALAMLAGLARRWPIRPTAAAGAGVAVEPGPQPAGRPC
jgi:hypothetical protein